MIDCMKEKKESKSTIPVIECGGWVANQSCQPTDIKASKARVLCELTRPKEATMALEMLAHGDSKVKISKATGLDRNTIRSLAWRHSETLEAKRAVMAKRFAQAAEEYTDLLLDKVDYYHDNPEALAAVSPEKLAITAGIMTDKAMKLSGMADTFIEVGQKVSIQDAIEAIAIAKAKFRTASPVIEAEVME